MTNKDNYSILDRLGQIYCEIEKAPEKWHDDLGRAPEGYETMTEEERKDIGLDYMAQLRYMIDRPADTIINWYHWSSDSICLYIQAVRLFPELLYPESKAYLKPRGKERRFRLRKKIVYKLKILKPAEQQ